MIPWFCSDGLACLVVLNEIGGHGGSTDGESYLGMLWDFSKQAVTCTLACTEMYVGGLLKPSFSFLFSRVVI